MVSLITLLCSFIGVTSYHNVVLDFDGCIKSENTPMQLEIIIKNNMTVPVSFGREYHIEILSNGEWVDINACTDFKSDGLTIGPFQTSKQRIYIPKLKKGEYRIWKNIETESHTYFLSRRFFVKE